MPNRRVTVRHSLRVKFCKVPLTQVALERLSLARGVSLNAQARMYLLVFMLTSLEFLIGSFDVVTGRSFEKCALLRTFKCRQQ